MKTLFDTGAQPDAPADSDLLLEIGRDFCSHALWHRATNRMHRLQYHRFDETEAERHLASLLLGLRAHSTGAVTVCSAFPEAVLVPAKYFGESNRFVDALFDEPQSVFLNDRIAEWQVVNSHALPQWLHRNLTAQFPEAQFLHAYTPEIKLPNSTDADSQLRLQFAPTSFRVLLKKDATLQLAQTYAYASPLDVVYYLLKIVEAFGLNQSTTELLVGGLVERDSNLYTELDQYFANLRFVAPPTAALPESNLPPHFFASLYNLAACVS